MSKLPFALVGIAMVVTSCERGREVEPGTPAHEPGTFALDFSTSKYGGVKVGNLVNLAFAIDVRQPLRTYALQSATQVSVEGLQTTFDYADCLGAVSQLEQQVGTLAVGTPTTVAWFEVELLGPDGGGPPWSGRVCFGYRDPAGVWRWNRETLTPIALDAVDKRWRAHVPVETGPMDAIKIVFSGVPSQPLARVTYRVKE